MIKGRTRHSAAVWTRVPPKALISHDTRISKPSSCAVMAVCRSNAPLWKTFQARRRAPRLSRMASMLERSQSAPAASVLIAEDNRDSREMYALYLSMLGYNVKVAVEGREAVVSARRPRRSGTCEYMEMSEV